MLKAETEALVLRPRDQGQNFGFDHFSLKTLTWKRHAIEAVVFNVVLLLL